jgi:hypothetical protein
VYNYYVGGVRIIEITETHTVTITMTYANWRKLSNEIDDQAKILSCQGIDPKKDYPVMTELWNALP